MVWSRRITGMPWVLVVARGVALFFGVFSLANALIAVVSQRGENVWWLDLDVLPGPLSWAAGLIAGTVLIEFAFRPKMPSSRRQLTAGVCAMLAGVAAVNSFGFFLAVRSGNITSGIGWPFSLLLVAVFALLAALTWWGGSESGTRLQLAGAVAWALLTASLFPVAQVVFFGTTDYRRPADAVIVFGARVNDDGTLSGSLHDRVLTAVEIYETGLAPRIIMSGGTGANGIDETSAMKAFAVARGVPEEAIEVDPHGINTDSTVRNTSAVLPDGDRVLVVSQFYHLPRIKLAYRAAGRDVYTVPARETLPIPKTPLFVAREVPGFWVYWLRAMWRDLAG